MAAKPYLDLDETVQAVECCYIVGRCRSCPLFKETGYGYLGKCIGGKKLVRSLLFWLAEAETNIAVRDKKQKELEEDEKLQDG